MPWKAERGRSSAPPTADVSRLAGFAGGGGVWICGGPKPGTAEPGTLVFVRAGTLDDTSWLRPSVHLWTDSAQPWVALPDGDVRFEMQPANYPAWLWSNTG